MPKSIDNVNHEGDACSAPSSATPDDALELMHAVMHALRATQHRLLRHGPHDLTPMDARVLGFFGRRPGATQSDLAEHSGRDKAQLARLIKGLRERGLLQGEVDAEDRRNMRLRLTAEGRTIHRALQHQARRMGTRAVAGMTAAEHAQLVALLQRMHANLAER